MTRQRKPKASDAASYAVDMKLTGPDGQPLHLTGTLTADSAPPAFTCPVPGDDVLTVAGAARVVHLPKSSDRQQPWTEAA
jgi:hypothetical protein